MQKIQDVRITNRLAPPSLPLPRHRLLRICLRRGVEAWVSYSDSTMPPSLSHLGRGAGRTLPSDEVVGGMECVWACMRAWRRSWAHSISRRQASLPCTGRVWATRRIRDSTAVCVTWSAVAGFSRFEGSCPVCLREGREGRRKPTQSVSLFFFFFSFSPCSSFFGSSRRTRPPFLKNRKKKERG